MTEDLPWRNAHRVRLHTFANNNSHNPLSFLIPDLGQTDHSGQDAYYTPDDEALVRADARETSGPLGSKNEHAKTRDAMDFFFDMKLSGTPLQCSDDDGTCLEMW